MPEGPQCQNHQDALEAFIDESIRQAVAHDYHPTVFIGMRGRHGTVAAISRLVQSGDIQSGFKRMDALNLLKWTIEQAVVQFPERFSRDDLECAKFRIRMANGELGDTDA
jgi:hypothetical protein